MSESYVFPDSKAIESLQLELELLRILHHRNKNQHHLQPFFKHLSILKRTIAHLLQNPDSEYLLHKLRNIVIPHAWEEFSRVVARGEFVTLGMVLCASVARIAHCLGGIEGINDIQEEEMEETLNAMREYELGEVIIREEGMEGESMEVETIAQEMELVTPSRMISVRDVEDHAPTDVTAATATISETVTREIDIGDTDIGDIFPPTKKRRKKKGNDDIDLLFAGL